LRRARVQRCANGGLLSNIRRAHDKVPATHNERRRGQRFWRKDEVPAKKKRGALRAAARAWCILSNGLINSSDSPMCYSDFF
jgi:hypothetical protein